MAVPGTKPQNFVLETVMDNTDDIPYVKETASVFVDSRIKLNNFLSSGGALTTRGDWNAATNTPTLVSSAGEKGELYRVSVAGTTSLDGIATWKPNDFVYFDGSVWRRNFGSNTTVELFRRAGAGGSTLGTHIVTQIAATGSAPFGFNIPLDFVSLVSCELIGQASLGAAGASKDIDLVGEFGVIGEGANNTIETDNTTVYDLTGFQDLIKPVLDLSVVMTAIAAGDYVGVSVTHNAIGGFIDYLGVKLIYLR